MSRRQVLEIARWELARYFKLRDIIITALLIGGISAASYGFSWWQSRSQATAEIAVVSELALPERHEGLAFVPHAAGELPALRQRVAAEQLDAILILTPDSAQVVARHRPHWLGELRAVATEALRANRLDAMGVTPEAMAAALAPAELELELLEGSATDRRASHAALLMTGTMLAGLFFGLTYLFMSITGEKQQRISEQMFVMCPPQALIDGKLLGHAAMAMIVLAQTAVVGGVALELVSGGVGAWLASTLTTVSPPLLLALIAYAALGFAFWFSVTAAWFSTIQDPMSSARSNALMLPFLPLSAAFVGLSNPDSTMMIALAQLPLTSMTVMPARLVLGQVSVFEVLTSLVLLALATVAARRAAARIYEAGMLMYGKEPSLREMLRWMRAPSRAA